MATGSCQKGKQSFLFSFNKLVESESVQMSALRHEQMNSLIFHSFTAAAHKIIILIRELEEEVPALVTSKVPLTSGS